MKRLSLMQRGYLMGLRRAKAKAQQERNELADQFENVIDEIHAEMRGVRDELRRLRMFDKAILAERDPAMWLNLGRVPRKAQTTALVIECSRYPYS